MQQTVDGVAYTFATFAISFACLLWGEHVAAVVPSTDQVRGWRRREARTAPGDEALEKPSSGEVRSKATLQLVTDYLVIFTAALAYLIALLLYFYAPARWRHRATFPILLSPPGAMLRFYLSTYNTRAPFTNRFPIGTFIANIGGTLVIGGSYAAQFSSSSRTLGLQCNALYAIQQGFCGCLTTVSTFITETRSIRGKRWTWLYVGTSIVTGHLAILVTFGAVGWSQGRGELCTGQI